MASAAYHGGMRWIKERVEAVIQLRCVEANDDFDRFTEFARNRIQAQALTEAIVCPSQANLSLSPLSELPPDLGRPAPC